MDIKKLLLVFYCVTICSAEKKSSTTLTRRSYAAAAATIGNRANGAQPAEDDHEKQEFLKNERRAQEMAARRIAMRDEMETDDTQGDDWDEEDPQPVKVARRDMNLPSHIITADGKWYEIPERQCEQYSRGEITWEDVMCWIRAFAAD